MGVIFDIAIRKMYREKAKPSDKEGFGNCTNLYECQAACPKGITVDYIAKMILKDPGATETYAEKVYGKD